MSTWLDYGMLIYLFTWYFLVCLWKYFRKRLALVLVDWGKQMVFSYVGGDHLIFWGSEWNKKSEGVWIHSLSDCSLAMMLIFSCLQCSWFSGHQPWTGISTISFPALVLRTIPSTSLSLHFTDGLWDFPASIIIWTNIF